MAIIKRDILPSISAHLSTKEITILLGPRQVGKTTLLLDLEKQARSEGRKTFFLNLDVERDSTYASSQDDLIRKIRLEFGDSPGLVFIDEIQRKPEAGLFLKGLYDLGLPYKFVVSGSGSLELKSKTRESLVGRKREFELLPISFSEFARYQTNYRYEDRWPEFSSVEGNLLRGLLDEYLTFGGYPRIVTEPEAEEKRRLLDELFRGYVEKDISFLLRVERTGAFTRLIRLLASQTGRMIRLERLSAESGISVPTVKQYLGYAEKTYILRTVPPYFNNPRKEITKSPNVYFYDTGLRNHALGQLGGIQRPEEWGWLLQNAVGNLLSEAVRWKGWTVHYWRTINGAEVDFVLNKQHEIVPVEVKYARMTRPELTRSFLSFLEKYKPREAWMVHLGPRMERIVKGSVVRFIPFFDLHSTVSGEW
jgi:predicted AAA+ superfamily ATPase